MSDSLRDTQKIEENSKSKTSDSKPINKESNTQAPDTGKAPFHRENEPQD